MVSPDQAAMLQALMGGIAQPGVMQSGQNPTSQYGTSFMTGNPTVPGGMLGSSPYQSINPNAMNPMGQGAPNQQMQQPMSQYPGMNMPMFGQQGGGGGPQGQ